MKALNDANLQSILDSDLVWRRREISSLVTLAKSATTAEQHSIVRACVPLLYSHWEGFGRECFARYLEFVSYRRLKFSALVPSFIYLASIRSLVNIADAPIADGVKLVGGITDRREKTNKDSFRQKVSTKSNLRFVVLCDLLAMCGLSDSAFDAYQSFIDKELCDARNEIAHGSGAAPTLATFTARRDKTFELMVLLQNTVLNAAITKAYKV